MLMQSPGGLIPRDPDEGSPPSHSAVGPLPGDPPGKPTEGPPASLVLPGQSGSPAAATLEPPRLPPDTLAGLTADCPDACAHPY
jgi:hypothetical protein